MNQATQKPFSQLPAIKWPIEHIDKPEALWEVVLAFLLCLTSIGSLFFLSALIAATTREIQ